MGSMSDTPNYRTTLGSLGAVELKDLGQFLALALVVLYFCGFLIVNAYNGKFGVRDYDAFRTQYVVAGLIELALIGLFAFVGRWSTQKRDAETKEYAESLRTQGRSAFVSYFVAISASLADQIWRIVVCVFIASPILFSTPTDDSWGMGATNVALLVFQHYADKAFSSKLSYEVPVMLAKATLIGAFVWFARVPSIFLFGFFLTLWALLGFAYQFDPNAPNRLAYRVGATIFSLVILSTTLGAYSYGHIHAQVGGGAPVPVRLVLADQSASEELNRVVDIHAGVSDRLLLIAETTGELVLARTEKNGAYSGIVRVKHDSVRAIALDDFWNVVSGVATTSKR
jgi:hypothetical protein